jgi:hypothetical protein
MKPFYLSAAAAACFLICNFHSAAQASADTKQVVPGFRVEISYSEQAINELKRRAETVVVFGYPFGFPRPTAPKSLVSDMGEIGLGEFRTEVSPGDVANIPTLALNRNNLRYVEEVKLLVNVVSGRRSSRDNLLSCDIYEGDLAPVASKAIPIKCRLIGE